MFFGLETWVRNLSDREGSYVIGLFDCCRENKDIKSEKEKVNMNMAEGRGGGLWADD